MRNTKSKGRKLPLQLKMKLFFSIPFNQAASILFIVTLGLFIAFYPLLGIRLPILIKEQTKAQIKKIESTKVDKGKSDHIFAYHYIFNTKSTTEIHGVSYAKRGKAQVNDSVFVNYDANFPKRSILKGMKTSIFPTWTKWFFFFMFFISFKLFKEGIKNYRLKMHLIRFGKIITGKIISLEKQNVVVMGKEQYVLKYFYQTINGSEYTESQKIYYPGTFRDKEEVAILYSDLNPSQSILIDSLPYSINRFYNIR